MWQEVQAYEKRIEAWMATKSANTMVDHKSSTHDVMDDDAKQAPAIMQFEVCLLCI